MRKLFGLTIEWLVAVPFQMILIVGLIMGMRLSYRLARITFPAIIMLIIAGCTSLHDPRWDLGPSASEKQDESKNSDRWE